MEPPNWVYWPDQGKWRAYPEGSPDREIQTASFEELQFQIHRFSGEVTRSHRETPRLDRPRRVVLGLETPQYVLSQDQGKWHGHLRGYPEHSAHGESFDEVQFKLIQLCRALIAGKQLPQRKAA
jgi:hypothetical protein